MSEPNGPEGRGEDTQSRGETSAGAVAAAGGPGGEGARLDPTPELHRLVDLATKYPEIGPPLAGLAFKIGQREIGDRLLRMGASGGAPGIEYYLVAANAARAERRWEDACRMTLEAVRAFAAADASALGQDDGPRLLHLVRAAFATLMFDRKDVRAEPALVDGLAELFPRLEGRLGGEAFYHTLLAQVLWYRDPAASELAWDRAAELGEPELTWNARGTWYKEAEGDLDKAEGAYRLGLEAAPRSALVMHNLSQVLVDKAARPEVDVEAARRLCRQADELLRRALKEDGPRGLRRHVHATKDRLAALRASLPGRGGGERPAARAQAPERLPEVGEVLRGRVVSVAPYGAFVSLEGGPVGLLHKTELGHDVVDDATRAVQVGDELEVKVIEVSRPEGGRLRIGLSRRALLPAPAGAPGPRADGAAGRGGDRRGGRRDGGERQRQGEKPAEDRAAKARRDEERALLEKFPRGGKLASLGELLRAKLKEQGGDQ